MWGKKAIDRPRYYDTIKPFIDKPFVKVLTGVRHCGKSTILLFIQEFLKESGVPEAQIISINFESMAYYNLRDGSSLYTYITDRVRGLTGTV